MWSVAQEWHAALAFWEMNFGNYVKAVPGGSFSVVRSLHINEEGLSADSLKQPSAQSVVRFQGCLCC